MKRTLFTSLTVIALCLSMPHGVSAAVFGKKKPAPKETTAMSDSTKSSSGSKYDRLFKGKNCTSAKSPFITLHKFEGGKLYIELPLDYLGCEMVLASTISEVSNPNYAAIGYKPKDPIHFTFEMGDSTVLMKSAGKDFTVDPNEANLAEAMKITSLSPIINSFKIAAQTNDKKAIVFDVSALFNSNHALLTPMGTSNSGLVSVSASFVSSGSYINEVKAFEDNAMIKSTLSYTLTASMLGMTMGKDIPFTLMATRTILLLPERKMRPRVSDSRLGIFLTGKYRLTTKADQVKRYSIAHRWKVEPKDMEAYNRGELVEPVKPIVYYLDNTFPENWKDPVRKGALRWNAAFEKIGFKDVVRVVDFPTDDPEFDPDNLKYSCIRYIPNTVSNAMGPSWVDPDTGEIINASVLIFNDVMKVINQWRFVQTAAVDPRVRNKKMPDDVIAESLEYIVAHEVGHTLGFMHNMSASAAIPVDSLRSATYTAKYGTTTSIMDYARFNYVAQPGDKDVRLTPPCLGQYDYFLVKWLYQPVDVTDYMDEVPVLEKWLDEKADDPVYRYGRQQAYSRYDPSAIEEDLGDDPIKASTYGIANLKYINAHLNEWIEDDGDFTFREMSYNNLGNQFYRYVKNVMLNVGGIYLTGVKDGTPGKSVIAVPKKVQRESLLWCIRQLKESDWLVNEELNNRMGLRVALTPVAQYYAGLELMTSYTNVPLSAHVSDDPYTMREYCDDMYAEVWKSTLAGRKLTRGEQILQQLLVQSMLKGGTKESNLIKVGGLTDGLTVAMNSLPSVDELCAYGLDRTGMVERFRDHLRDIEAEYGKGYVASQLFAGTVEFGHGYGWQPKVNPRTIDNSKECLYAMTLRTQKMLRTAAVSAPQTDRAHYQMLLYSIDSALKDTK